MKKHYLWLFVALLLVVPSFAGFASAEDLSTDKGKVMAMVGIIETEPLSSRADLAREGVLAFAIKSDDIQVTVYPQILPWYGQSEWSELLMRSFIAGNVRSQLLKGKPENDTYAGLLLMFNSYRELKKNNPSLKIDEIEKQLELLKQDKLRPYITEMEKQVTPKT